jgi:hypothetical protein
MRKAMRDKLDKHVNALVHN